MAHVASREVAIGAFDLHNGTLSTTPPLIELTHTRVVAHDTMPMRFRHKALGLAVIDESSGVVLAWSEPGPLHSHSISHRAHQWRLTLHRPWWGTHGPTRQGLVECSELGTADFEACYMHYVSQWHDHRRRHRAWVDGSLHLDGDVPGPVLALALRLILGRHWFGLRTGAWSEFRREWDFGGF